MNNKYTEQITVAIKQSLPLIVIFIFIFAIDYFTNNIYQSLISMPPFLGTLLGAVIGVLGAVGAMHYGHHIKERRDKEKIVHLLILELNLAQGLIKNSTEIMVPNETIGEMILGHEQYILQHMFENKQFEISHYLKKVPNKEILGMATLMCIQELIIYYDLLKDHHNGIVKAQNKGLVLDQPFKDSLKITINDLLDSIKLSLDDIISLLEQCLKIPKEEVIKMVKLNSTSANNN